MHLYKEGPPPCIYCMHSISGPFWKTPMMITFLLSLGKMKIPYAMPHRILRTIRIQRSKQCTLAKIWYYLRKNHADLTTFLVRDWPALLALFLTVFTTDSTTSFPIQVSHQEIKLHTAWFFCYCRLRESMKHYHVSHTPRYSQVEALSLFCL